VNLFDRFLEKKSFKSSDLQLIGIGALIIACKYEEIYAPEIRDFRFISENSFTPETILKMEYEILVTLDFDILHVSPLVFLKRFHQISQGAFKSLYLAQFILESSMLEYQTLRFTSSVRAAAALFISRKLLQIRDVWPEELVISSGHTKESLEECIASLYRIIKMIPSLTLCSTKKKYADKKYFEISKEYVAKFKNCSALG
jgi:cyclin B